MVRRFTPVVDLPLVTLPVLIYNKHFNSTTCKFHGTVVYGDLATTSEKY